MFQSTRPVWGATQLYRRFAGIGEFQSTRPVWGATFPNTTTGSEKQFQSTRPVWGATPFRLFDRPHVDVSIHAPRVGRDSTI